MQTVSSSWLHSLETMKDVPDDQLQWLIDHSNHYTLAEGEYLFKPGDPIIGTHFIIEGVIKLFFQQNGQLQELNTLQQGDISGALPFSRGVKATVAGQVVRDARIMTLPVGTYRELVSRNFELTAALVHIMTTRVRNFTSLQQQNEKMMALGKLSAGLTHELNNPAAAIVRGAQSLLQHLRLVPKNFKDVIAIRMDEKEVDLVNDLLFEILARKDKPVLTLMERTEKEDVIRDWLDDHQVDNSGEIAENFLDYGFTCEDLKGFSEHIPPAYLSPVFNWINSNLVTERMVEDIRESSQRISELVNSVKNFTHMDQGKGKEYVDIHTGIKNTLTILHYKIKKGNVEVVESYDSTLPKVKALVGELNQVWTNLLDNALDAMEGMGAAKLIITTEKDGDFAKVTITDNGPGIPDDIKSRIFDPFFTTKEIGKGTGLGLDVVMQIVRQHQGSVKVNSAPGRTEFIVCFPING